MACIGFLFVVLVQLGCGASLTRAFPADVLCLGKKENGQVHFKVTPDITEETHDCDIQWLVNDSVSALFDDNGKPSFKPPILNATFHTAIVENKREYKIEYISICPRINVHRRLLCSCSNSTFLGSLPKNDTFATKESYPYWWIAIVVTAGITLLAVVTLLVCKKVRKNYKCFQKVENETL